MLRVALNELRIADTNFRRVLAIYRSCGLRIFFPSPGFSYLKHSRAEVETGDFRAVAREGKGDVTGATAQIKRPIAGSNGGEFDDPAFPAPVQAEALEVVEQVVSPRDGGKKVVDLCRALFAGSVETVAHAGSLAHWRAQKP